MYALSTVLARVRFLRATNGQRIPTEFTIPHQDESIHVWVEAEGLETVPLMEDSKATTSDGVN